MTTALIANMPGIDDRKQYKPRVAMRNKANFEISSRLERKTKPRFLLLLERPIKHTRNVLAAEKAKNTAPKLRNI
jgi:hypothetical protein